MWWVLLPIAILLLICFLPVGIVARYDDRGFWLWLKVGPYRHLLIPEKDDAPVEKKTKHGKTTNKGGSLKKFLPIWRSILRLLNELRKRLRVNKLECKLVLGGSDPCDLSILYGRTCAAIGSLMPHLHNFLKIKKQNINVQCDYSSDNTTVYCYADATIGFARLLHFVLRDGLKVYKEYQNIKYQRKGGTDNEPETSSHA